MAQVRDEPFTAPFAAGGLTPAQRRRRHRPAGLRRRASPTTPPTTRPSTLADVFYTGQRTEALTPLEQSARRRDLLRRRRRLRLRRQTGGRGPVVWTVDAGEQRRDGQRLREPGPHRHLQRRAGGGPGGRRHAAGLARWRSSTTRLARSAGTDPSARWPWSPTPPPSTTAAQAAGAPPQSLLRLRLKQTRSLEADRRAQPGAGGRRHDQVVFPDGREERHLIDAVSTDLATAAPRASSPAPTSTPDAELVIADQLFYGREAWEQVAA